jgi:hypothetical protein
MNILDTRGYGRKRDMQKIINVGCGLVCFPCAENLDKVVKHENSIFGDVNDLQYQDQTIDVVIMVSPYLFYPLITDAGRILKPNGLLIVVGSIKNRYFKSVWKASSNSLKVLGYELV